MGRRDETPEAIMDTVSDIKKVLEFYQALGFERLPIKIDASCKTQVASKNTRYEIPKQNPESGIQNPRAETVNPELQTPNHTLSASQSFGSDLKSAALQGLRDELNACRRCNLAKGRKNIVFGEGSPDADIMFIGEAPGREEDLKGEPFVGEAGELLTRLIEKVGLKRKEVYIGNIVKCRPPSNRDPLDDEIEACMPFIERQIELIMPKAIIALGGIASHALTGTKIPITKLRGNFYEYKGIPLMPTFHPAYLLRNPDLQERWRIRQDVEKVLHRLKEEGE